MDVKYLKYLCVWFVGHIRVKSWKKLLCICSRSGNVHVEVWIEDTELYPSFNGRPCVTPLFCTIGLNGGPWAMPQFCTIVQNISLPNHIIFGRKWSFFCNKHIAHIITKRREKSFLPKCSKSGWHCLLLQKFNSILEKWKSLKVTCYFALGSKKLIATLAWDTSSSAWTSNRTSC